MDPNFGSNILYSLLDSFEIKDELATRQMSIKFESSELSLVESQQCKLFIVLPESASM